MTTDEEVIGHRVVGTRLIDKHYDQFILFGDSITQDAGRQDKGFAFAPALQEGNVPFGMCPFLTYDWPILVELHYVCLLDIVLKFDADLCVLSSIHP